MLIRQASPADAPRLLDVYAPYVRETAITFEYKVPSVDEFSARIERTLSAYPYLVAEDGDRLLGYAYASRFQERRAYDWAAETSIYVARDAHGRGVGRALHDTLRDELLLQGVQDMCACIAAPRGEDPHLTTQSIDFHAHLGYRMVGRFDRVGMKFGTWYDMVWMQLPIGMHPAPAPDVTPWPELG